MYNIYKNEWKEHKFWWQKNQKKHLLQKQKNIYGTDDIDVNNILVSKKEPYGTKKFIGYNDNDNIRPLCIRLS